jgi:protein-S-isoprenylcysteine O-methyltransferase Ste14
MRKLKMIGVLLVLAIAATASAQAAASAKWSTYPTCTATTTTLTCTGAATGLNQKTNKFGTPAPAFAQIVAGAFYTCVNDPSVTGTGFSFVGDGAVGPTRVQNGRAFSLRWSPPAAPNDSEQLGCPGNTWTRDPKYSDVGVGIWQVAELAFVLFANVGDVSPS